MSNSTHPGPGHARLLTREEVAALLRVTTRSVNNWVAQGILKPVRLPGRTQARGYLESDVLHLLKPQA
ncbi:MAG TPA: helix-turn-helix domain-containing protein [Kiritimatiellia bacterium]|nr:helix-turn-helix domain-containing protein [Kiritimatiellia bacterium]HPS09536.1 helix-turn-helix domain-containing protein [Kiritimatiellia bacterium]